MDLPQASLELRFDLRNNISLEWFQTYARELERYGAAEGAPDCDVRYASNIDNRRGFRQFAPWVAHILGAWDDIAESYIWSNGGILKRAICDHQRQSVRLQVTGKDPDALEQILREIAGRLDLRESEREPYRYRRSSLEFDIKGKWQPKLFAAGVVKIANDLLGGRPAVREAYAKTFEAEVERLTPFYDLREFLQAMNTPVSIFGEVRIVMEGRGYGVGISVPADHKKLRVRTSVAPNAPQLELITEAWPNQLDLNMTKAADPGSELSGAAAPPPENQWLKYGSRVAVALIAAATTAGVVFLYKAMWPDYSVVITTPDRAKGAAEKVVSLNWYIKPEGPSFHHIQFAPAEIIIYGPNGNGISQRKTAQPPTDLQLAQGQYRIEVKVPGAKPDGVDVVVNPGAGPSSQ